MQKDIQELLERQRRQLKAVLNKSLCLDLKPIAKFSLRRLPMWACNGTTADQVNFEWPTVAMIMNMPANVFLKSIELKASDRRSPSLSSVRCVLSTDQSSPIFQRQGMQHHFYKKTNFEEGTVKRVAANVSDGTKRLTFLSEEREQIGNYILADHYGEEQEFWLKENEELIGVYGVKDQQDWLTGFGFIVKVNKV